MGTYQLSSIFQSGYGVPGFFNTVANAVVSVVSGGRVSGSYGGLVNALTGVNGEGGYGIILAGDHSYLSNLGGIYGGNGGRSQSTGGYGGWGVAVSTNVHVVNHGNIQGGNGGYGFSHTYYNPAAGRLITYSNGGVGGGGLSLDTGSTLDNYGRIAGGTNGFQAGPFANLGATPGVYAKNSLVDNRGTIIGGTGGAHDAYPGRSTGNGGAGVYLNGGTLVNYGTIIGGYPGASYGAPSGSRGAAVSLSANAATIVAKAGSSFVGDIGGTGSGHVLILDSGGPGTFAAFVSGMNTIDVASYGSWTILGAIYSPQTFSIDAHASVDLIGSIRGTTITMGSYATLKLDNAAGLSGSTLDLASGHDILELGTATTSFDLGTFGTLFTGTNRIGIGDGASVTLTQSGGTGNDTGVAIFAGGTAIVTGNIQGAAGAYDHVSAAAGTTAIGFYVYGGGTLINTGTLTGGNGGQSFYHGGEGAVGVDLTGAGYFSNTGVIAGGYGGPDFAANNAIGATGGDGVRIDGSGTLVNTGSISGGRGGFTYFANGPAGAGGDGVYLNGGTLINLGTISGGAGGPQNPGPMGDAVRFGANGGTLIIETGGVFIGAVVGDGANSHLVLASQASAGTLSGLGSEYIGFQSLTIDAGATWTVAGTIAGFGTTAIDGFSSQDKLDLTDLAFNSSDTATLNGSDQLVIADTGGNITIQMDSAVSGGQFTLVSDGHGGTFVEEFAPKSQITGYHGSGVTLGQGAYTNPVTVAGSATISNAAGNGLVANSSWTIDNAGTVSGGSEGINLLAGAVNNSGTIVGSFQSLYVAQSGTVLNSGLIRGGAGGGVYGVQLHGGGDFVNEASGTVTGVNYAAVVRGASGTIENFGTLAAANQAVYMGATHSLLIDHAGAVFVGNVVAGHAASSATIELASDSAAGTLSGLGSQFTGFGTIAIDSGAAWTIAGSAAAFGATTIDGFNVHDRLDLTNLAFNAADTATLNGSNQLVILDAGGNTTIQMDSAASGYAFTLVSDSHGGTFVEEVPATPQIDSYHGSGITLAQGAYANPFTVTGTGTVYDATGAAIQAGSDWTVDNAGTVSGASQGISLLSGAVHNTGTIAGGSRGVYVAQTGTVGNSGVIRGIGGSGVYGVLLHGGGVFLNEASGTVAGVNYGAVVRGASGKIENFGTIAAANQAVYMGATHSLLIDHAGAVFSGNVVAGHSATSATIELASGSAAGTLSGLGSQFTGFGTIAIDSGAAWTIAGSAAAFGTTTIDGFNGFDRLDITGLAFNAGDTATLNGQDQMVIQDAGGNITIQMDSAVSGHQFTLASDGSGGTFVEELTSRISGSVATGITLNAASYADPLTITSGGAIYSASGNGISSAYDWTIQNAGSIHGGNFGVGFTAGGSIGNTGTIIGGNFGVFFNETNYAATVDNSGLIRGASNRSGFGVALYGGGDVINDASGSIAGVYAVVVRGASGTIDNSGTITGGYRAVYMGATQSLLIDHPGAVFNGYVVAGPHATSATIELASGSAAGTLSGLGIQIGGFGTIAVDSGAAWLIGGSYGSLKGETITGFNSHDRLDLTDIAFDAGDTVTYSNNGLLVIRNSTNTGQVTLHLSSSDASPLFQLLSDGHGGMFVEETGYAPCYLRGTLIRTPGGNRPVEDLRIGDLVTTADGEPLPIKWVGRRSYRDWLAVGNDEVQPIRFKPGAISDHVPARDLFVSPEHAMFLDGVLVPAHLLVNGASIVKTDGLEEVDYYHLEFERHVVIFAEGAAAESFVDDDSRMTFHNADEYRRLYPDEPLRRDAVFCAARIEAGPILETLRRRVGGRASRLRADGTAAAPRLCRPRHTDDRGRLGAARKRARHAGDPGRWRGRGTGGRRPLPRGPRGRRHRRWLLRLPFRPAPPARERHQPPH